MTDELLRVARNNYQVTVRPKKVNGLLEGLLDQYKEECLAIAKNDNPLGRLASEMIATQTQRKLEGAIAMYRATTGDENLDRLPAKLAGTVEHLNDLMTIAKGSKKEKTTHGS